MFTGLVETVGEVMSTSVRGNYVVLDVRATFGGEPLAIGESICIDGACLTVLSHAGNQFVTEASQETIAKTIVRQYKRGTRINLERALRPGDRLGGHLVAGHIDTRGMVDRLRVVGDSLELAVKYEAEFDSLVIPKGSIAVSGVSLTINEVRSGWCNVNLIPHTAKVTTLGELTSGAEVNIEFDMIGKYIVRRESLKGGSLVTMETLRKSGW